MSVGYIVNYSGNFEFLVTAENEQQAKEEARKSFNTWLTENAYASDFSCTVSEEKED